LHLRDARGAARPAVGAAALAVGGGAGVVRDRAPASLPRRSGLAAGGRRGARDADRAGRAAALQRPLGVALPGQRERRREHRARVRRLDRVPGRRRMSAPPKVLRRAVIAPLVVFVELLILAASPVLAALSALLSPLLGGRRPVRALALVLAWCSAHLASVG